MTGRAGRRARVRRWRGALGLGIVLALIGGAPPAWATVPATVTVRGGGLSLVALGPSRPSSAQGPGRLTDFAVPLLVVDATGTGDGWHLTLAWRPPRAWGRRPRAGMATDAVVITGVESRCAHSSCTATRNTVAYPVAASVGDGLPALTFFSTGSGTGMGGFVVTPTIAATQWVEPSEAPVPGELTLTIAAGP